jgi:formylglycine-generating enzyme required for sulfatase activity
VRQSGGAGATSHTRGFTGTIASMPPESFDGTVSPAWDMWSMGVLVLEALTGRTPFGDVTEQQLMRAIFTEAPIIPPDLPQPFGEIVGGCLTKDYRVRWSAQRVIEALRQHWHVEAAERTAAGRQAPRRNLRTPDERPEPRQPRPATVRESPRGPEVVPPPAPPITDSQDRPVAKRLNWAWVLALAVIMVGASVWMVVAGRHASEAPKGTPIEPATTGTTRVNPKDRLTYIWIPAGTFTMGCSPGDSECDDHEKPAHHVTITKGFWMGQTGVTLAAYERVIGSNPSEHIGAALPVETISWDEAHAYCVAAGMRLPTEAEWEYAARGGNASARYGTLDAAAWSDGNSGGKTHEVGQKQANTYGLYDMLGNVWEWVADWYGYYGSSPLNDPGGPSSGDTKVLRGGSWNGYARNARASQRTWFVPGYRFDYIGVRCAGD